MNFLLDMTVSPTLVQWLKIRGHSAVHAHQIGLAKASDQEIIDLAKKDGQIIITADLDFPRIIALAGDDGPPLILFRGGDYSEKEMRNLVARVLESVREEDIRNSITVVDKFRIRKTRIPLGEKDRE